MYDDWILDVKWIDNDENIAIISMHNIITLWTKEMKLVKRAVCEEKCILYSSHLVNDTWSNLIVLSGTVFSQVLIWWPKTSEDKNLCSILCKLNGHKGVIFSIHYNPKAGLICSTSDDRYAIIWSIASRDLLTELSLSKAQIVQRCSLYGHTARVFKCRVLSDSVVTAGEDSIINIWNFNGQLIRKIEAHQGAPVWSFECDESDNLIISGGGDCGITIFPLNQNVTKYKINMWENPKRVAILKNNDLVTISEKGLLEYYNVNKNKKIEIARHNDLVSYALLEISPCRYLIALAGYHGTVHIYKQVDQVLKLVCSHIPEEKFRIFSFHWLSSSNYLICGPDGNMSLWDLKKDSLSHRRTFKLPPSKERWTTVACSINNKHFAVGDRKGNIYLYSEDLIEPIQTIRKAHNYLGVTNMCIKQKELFSLGRNSILKRYLFKTSLEQLSLLSSDKLPFTWLATLYETDETTLLLSFLGDEFVIWDYNKRRTLLQFHCGGGHRSWDFYKNSNHIYFVYIKDKCVHSVQLDWDGLYPLDIINGYHSSEINSGCCLNSSRYNNKCLFISGGEDTTLRISVIEFKNNFTQLKTLNTLKSHLSSIRTVSAFKVNESTDNECTMKYLIFSAGGRAQIIIWELIVNYTAHCKVIVSCNEKYSYYEQLKDEDSENRIMDLCTISKNEYVVLVAACSDGTLKVFLIVECKESKNNYKMLLVKNINYKLKCILKVSHLEILGHNIILSMATDGKITLWDFTTLLNNIYLNIKSEVNDESSVIKNLFNYNLNAFMSIDVHQSGVNSFTYRVINNNQCIFLSGGDDNAVIANLIEFSKEKQSLNAKILSTFSNVSSHCAQITGVSLFNNYFLTTSIDQKLNIFKWNIENKHLHCMYLQTHNLAIADIHGMQCYKEDNSVYVIVFGKGVEVCQIQLDLKS
ncbi:hypothetical protein ILUMI_08973 [Ignelater luminosus]|uniref:tRNA (34-2'-O)-methyltransferase regulator WDR6 n=1 Tax=Ignelater luminosus TaxID=2038154 RepID=A0A8K0D3C8_IGNLU|nr:hypothetical protein ILUMI_08973 [Ignelater luminosus]